MSGSQSSNDRDKINAILEYLREKFPSEEPTYFVKPDTGSLHVEVFTPESRKAIFSHEFMGDRDLRTIRDILSGDALARFIRQTPADMDVAVSTEGPQRVERGTFS